MSVFYDYWFKPVSDAGTRLSATVNRRPVDPADLGDVMFGGIFGAVVGYGVPLYIAYRLLKARR